MKLRARALVLTLCLMLLLPLLPERAEAAATIYFTSVNDRLCELSDATMPFWQNGLLYVAGETLHDVDDLKLRYYYNREQSTAIVYQGKTALYCDLTDGTMKNNRTGEYFSGSPIVRDGMVFFPISTVASVFDLHYTSTKITYGYLVRIRNDNAILSDASFIDAAAPQLQQRYTQYERAHAAAEQPADTAPAVPAVRTALTVYLLLPVTDEAEGMALLDTLSSANAHATLLMTPELIERADDLVRRAAATGNAIAISLDSLETEAALARTEAANAALWQDACICTRLVHLASTDKPLRAALTEAGYCPITVNASDFYRSGTHWAQTVLDWPASSGSIRLYLGADANLALYLGTALTRLSLEDCTLSALNEVTA